jgi:hypothetical protein
MKPLHWAMLAAFLVGIPIGYGGLFLVSVAIGFAKAKATPPPVTVLYVDRVAARPSPLSPSSAPEAETANAPR